MTYLGIFLVSLFIFSTGQLFGTNIPIVFVHGHKSEGRPEGSPDDPDDKSKGGWGTWYPRKRDGSFDYHTAMTKIIGYRGYQYGLTSDGSPAKFCDINTQLKPNQGTKRIFNFSYYHPDGEPGVISLKKEETFSEQEREKQTEIPFWKRLGFSIGYSGGFALTGDDLMKSGPMTINPIELLILRRIYWLNSIEGSIIYPFNKKWGIEIGGGYGWANLKNTVGLHLRIPIQNSDVDANIYAKDWNIHILKFFSAVGVNKNIKIGGTFYLFKAITIEKYYEGLDFIEQAKVLRIGIGKGAFIKFIFSSKIFNLFVPFLEVRVGDGFEYRNNAPWEWKWNDKLYINFTGIYVGLQLKKGGD